MVCASASDLDSQEFVPAHVPRGTRRAFPGFCAAMAASLGVPAARRIANPDPPDRELLLLQLAYDRVMSFCAGRPILATAGVDRAATFASVAAGEEHRLCICCGLHRTSQPYTD